MDFKPVLLWNRVALTPGVRGDVADGSALTLDEIGPAVERGLAAGRTRVVVKAHRRARWGDVSEVTRRAALEGVRLHFGVREKD